MAATTVSIVGGPSPYQEALTARLNAAAFSVVDGDSDVLVVCCTNDALWEQAAGSALWSPTVVVVPELNLDTYVKALALGAGAVHLDTPTEVMVDVVAAALAGEALLPLAITQALALHHPPSTDHITDMKLEGVETQIAERLVAGMKIGEIASDLSYSDRTIRRKLQGIYLKLGVAGRTAAIEVLRRSQD